jgi:zinc protease
MHSDYTQVKLENGLTVMLKEIHTAPLASVWIWYRVGSRNETAGMTGASHWVEHMQFKGTPQFPNGVLDKAISRLGGYWNAMTFLDWTTYLATMPASKIDLILSLEADRMINSTFSEEDVASERTVIISERQGNQNNPGFLLAELVQAAAFRVHSYHHQVIGDQADLETMSRDDLYQHYRRYYQPGNAVLAVAGAFETQHILDRIQELYSPIPAGVLPEISTRPEPPRQGEHTVTLEGPGDTRFIEIAYPAPAAADEDFYAFLVLDSLLCGPSSLNLFGGGISNKTSQLYQALVEKDIAVSVYGGLQATNDPYLYQVVITLHPASTSEKAMAAFDEQVKLVQVKSPTQEELERAVKQAKALFAYGSESITNQAFWLGFAEMFASYNWFETYLDKLAAVTPEDVMRVARKYLQRSGRVVGMYYPDGSEVAA